MRIENIFSRMAWGEREDSHRSAKLSAAMVVATFAALVIFCGSPSKGSQLSAVRAEQGQLPELRHEAAVAIGREWKHWTASDCDVISNYSNWATPSGMQGTVSGGLLIELRSALPIREAFLRQLQIKKHYDQLNPEQKLAFDKKNPPEIIENENDPILLYVERDRFSQSGDSPQEVALQLGDGTLAMPINTEALQDDGDGSRLVY